MAETSMVEKVARAIWADRNGRSGGGWAKLPDAHKEPYRCDARAAFKAMREPTHRMLVAGFSMSDDLDDYGLGMWEAAIDAALSEEG